VFSSSIRAYAEEAVQKIVKIFAIEENNTIVERASTDPLFKAGVNGPTHLSDSEIGEKTGYKVTFPQTLNSGYSLKEKCLGLYLEKDISLNLYDELHHSMVKAIFDDNEFKN